MHTIQKHTHIKSINTLDFIYNGIVIYICTKRFVQNDKIKWLTKWEKQ